MKRTKGTPGGDAIEKSGKALVDKFNAIEDALVQKRVVDGQTVINFPMRLNQFFIYLRNAIDDSDLGSTDGQRDRLGDLSEQWQQQQRAACRGPGRRPGRVQPAGARRATCRRWS